MVKKATRPARRRAVPAGESRRDRFLRIGNRRMNRAITSIRLLGNLASSNYEWTREDLRAMQAAITGAVEAMLLKFEIKAYQTKEPNFHFSGAATTAPAHPEEDDLLEQMARQRRRSPQAS